MTGDSAQEKAAERTPFAVDAITAHYAGDETPGLEVLQAIQTYIQDPDPVIANRGLLLGAFRTDPASKDTYVEIHLQSGERI